MLDAGVAADHYQWFFNGNSIPDSTQVIDGTAYGSGIFTVIASNGACESSVSGEFVFSSVSIDSEWLAMGWQVLPNPTNDFVYLQHSQTHGITWKGGLYNMVGQQLFTIPENVLNPVEKYQLNMHSLPEGVYLLRIETEAANTSIRIIKK